MSVLDGMAYDPNDNEYPYTDADGTSWRGLEDVLGSKVFGFCGCGAPDLALRLMRDALRLAARRGPHDFEAHRLWYRSVWEPERDRLFGADRPDIAYAIWYLLDDKGLTEHGGSVPGWLTPRGEEILADLETLFADADNSSIPAAHPEEGA